MSDKKASNLEKFPGLSYPGMKKDPRENSSKIALSDEAAWRLNVQAQCIGEEAQIKLLTASALILGATPLGVRIAQKLVLDGLGKVGVFGDEDLNGAHGLAGKPLPQSGQTLKTLAHWARVDAPWCKFESFSSAGIDRSLDDIVAGFDFVIEARGVEYLAKDIDVAGPFFKDGHLRGIVSAELNPEQACIALLLERSVEKQAKVISRKLAARSGVYYPLLDLAANRAEAVIFEAVLADPKCSITTFDSRGTNWHVEQL